MPMPRGFPLRQREGGSEGSGAYQAAGVKQNYESVYVKRQNKNKNKNKNKQKRIRDQVRVRVGNYRCTVRKERRSVCLAIKTRY